MFMLGIEALLICKTSLIFLTHPFIHSFNPIKTWIALTELAKTLVSISLVFMVDKAWEQDVAKTSFCVLQGLGTTSSHNSINSVGECYLRENDHQSLMWEKPLVLIDSS